MIGSCTKKINGRMRAFFNITVQLRKYLLEELVDLENGNLLSVGSFKDSPNSSGFRLGVVTHFLPYARGFSLQESWSMCP